MTRLLVLLAVMTLVSSCASVPPADGRSEVIRRILPSMVQIRTERDGGGRRAASGIVLASGAAPVRSWILITQHILEPPSRQQIYVSVPHGREPLAARVSAASADADLAILEVPGVALPPVRVKEVVELGDEVWVAAFPWGRRLTLVSGVISQLVSEEGETAVEGSPRMVDASVSYGSSGGGVFDAQSGALVAIVEGYRTARVTIPEAAGRTLDLPVAGETTVISAQRIVRFLVGSGLETLIAGRR